MNLILTSAGLSTEKLQKECQKLLTTPIQEVKVLIIYIKFSGPLFNELIHLVKQQFIELGILGENIKTFDLYAGNPPSLSDVDVILMFGGNENRYMDQIKKQGLYSEIRDFIDRNGVYVGISAGSIIMGPTVDIEHWSRASNDVGLVDKSGFGYVDFITVPHVDSMSDRAQKVFDFQKSTDHKMVYLTDNQGILVIDDMYKII